MASPPENRDSLISSAVGFLQDPTVASSPLAKRIAFLESKGLTSSEIEEALRRASHLSTPQNRFGAGYGGYRALNHQPDRDATDWRDWFVMTVIGGGVGYILVNLAKKYLIPALKPPTQTELEEAQVRLEQKYDQISEILNTIQADSDVVKKEMTEQTERLDKAMKEVELAVEECLAGEVKRDQELDSIHQEVNGLRTSVKEMMQSNKEAQTAAIMDLQTELKSLKSLMAARSGSSSTSTPPPASTNGISSQHPTPNGSGLNAFGLKPLSNPSNKFNITKPVGIPAWQLASIYDSVPNHNNSTSESNPSSETASSTTAFPDPSSSTQSNIYLNGNDKLPAHNDSNLTDTEPNSHHLNSPDEEDGRSTSSNYALDQDSKLTGNRILQPSQIDT